MATTTVLEEVVKVVSNIGHKDYEAVFAHVKEASRVFVAGTGRSGLLGKCFAMRLMHLGIETYMVGETTCPSIKSGDLLIIISCSGDRKNLLEFVTVARAQQAKVLSITSQKTPLVPLSDYSLQMPIEQSIQFGNSLFEQAVFLFLETFVEFYREKQNISFKCMAARHANLE